MVIDVDGELGARSLADLEAANGRLPITRRARSARGSHLYFTAVGRSVRCSAGRLGPGLDVRGDGGYIVAPPSRHATGTVYQWTETSDPAPVPGWLIALLAPVRPSVSVGIPADMLQHGGDRARRYFQAAVEGELLAVARAPVGSRNATLNLAAFRLGQLTGAGLGDAAELVNPLLGAALSAGLGEREARNTIASGLAAGESHPRRLGAAAAER
jgi:hypothetical protein